MVYTDDMLTIRSYDGPKSDVVASVSHGHEPFLQELRTLKESFGDPLEIGYFLQDRRSRCDFGGGRLAFHSAL